MYLKVLLICLAMLVQSVVRLQAGFVCTYHDEDDALNNPLASNIRNIGSRSKGDQGNPGKAGPAGPIGPPGLKGLKGIKGDPGSVEDIEIFKQEIRNLIAGNIYFISVCRFQ